MPDTNLRVSALGAAIFSNAFAYMTSQSDFSGRAGFQSSTVYVISSPIPTIASADLTPKQAELNTSPSRSFFLEWAYTDGRYFEIGGDLTFVTPPAAVPLPASGVLLFSALIGLAAARRLSRETQWSKAVAVSAMTPLGGWGTSRTLST
ncbi:MAG: VPLPA-CTERM sorting domain-containing protein [Pseudomonadota bacterium]